MSRPEHLAPADIFYGTDEAAKYTSNTRIATIQAEMSYRCVELLCLPEDEQCYLLDIGCGSGLSGEVIEEEGHYWLGVDIAAAMLNIAVQKDLPCGDLMHLDIGQGLGFRPGVFDGAISVSVIQWLCNADKSEHNPFQRLHRFFTTLFMCLKRGARAIFQFYPENDEQIQMILSSAIRTGFTGGLVVDYPNSKKARKYYLCLFAGQQTTENGKALNVSQQLPRALGEDMDGDDMPNGGSISYSQSTKGRSRDKGKRAPVKDKAWVLKKKEVARKRGEKTASDSKYTARKRRPRF
ncbi:hypothetical protein GQ42DRAFT_27197 [Ramicandelaber brevisporus]|nr:hypothetical protein GQ42DRAFT_27197 [Ramicandelaber brevisporus]